MVRCWQTASPTRSPRPRSRGAAEGGGVMVYSALETQQAAAGRGRSAARPSLTRLETRTKESMVGVRGQMDRSEPAAKASSVSGGACAPCATRPDGTEYIPPTWRTPTLGPERR